MNLFTKEAGSWVFCLCAFLLVSGADAGAAQAVLHVTPKGNDAGPGMTNEPLASLRGARDKVRSILAKGEMTADIEVHFAAGDYMIDTPVVFGPEDSGSNGFRVIYRNADKLGSAVLIGGEKLDNKKWKSYKPGLFYQELPNVTDIDIIYENRMKARKARIPNYNHLKNFPTADGNYFVSGRVGKKEPYLTAHNKDLNKSLLSALSSDLDKQVKQYLVVWGHGHADWHKWVYQISKIDQNNNQIFFDEKNPTLHSGKRNAKNRYYIEGGLRLLDTKGEFCFDHLKRRLYYMPYKNINESEIIYSKVKNIVKITKAKNIVFEGLEFTCSGVLAKTSSGYTWTDPDAAISILDSEYIDVKNCHFLSIGQTAINLKTSHNNTIENCLFEYIKMYNINQDSGDTAGLHMANVNTEKGASYINYFNQITITRSIAQLNITDEWKPTGVYLDHAKKVMNQSMSNIEVKAYDPRYPGYVASRFKGIYGKLDRTSDKDRQIMQNRPHNNKSSTKFNCSWSDDFDTKYMQYSKIGLTAEFPAEYGIACLWSSAAIAAQAGAPSATTSKKRGGRTSDAIEQALEVVRVDIHDRLYPDRWPEGVVSKPLSVPRGAPVTFQFAVRADSAGQARLSVTGEITGTRRIHWLQSVHVEGNTQGSLINSPGGAVPKGWMKQLVRSAPFDTLEVLVEGDRMPMVAGRTHGVVLELSVPRDTKPGLYEGMLRIPSVYLSSWSIRT